MPVIDFFFYGTLLDQDVRRAVLGIDIAAQRLVPGTLPHHVLRRVRDETYPMLLPRRHAAVRGLFATNLSLPEARLLDRFEGPAYRRSVRDIEVSDGRVVPAAVYLPCHALRAESRPWVFAAWQLREKRAFLEKISAARIARPNQMTAR